MPWLGPVFRGEVFGSLAEVYAQLAPRAMPEVYRPARGGVPRIIQVHTLDLELMRRTFAVSGALQGTGLEWAERELLASVTSRTTSVSR